jgi:putative RNA 2'-phosphotransferase
MAHALRHGPEKYGLEPDPEGWVSFDDLIIALRFERSDWLDLTRRDIECLLKTMESDRFEIDGAKIRAVYGHSINVERPPAIQNRMALPVGCIEVRAVARVSPYRV